MPMKICPTCDAAVGVRTLKCKCGFTFRPKCPPKILSPFQAEALHISAGLDVDRAEFPNKSNTKARTSEVLYDDQQQAVLENGGAVTGKLLRPIVWIKMSADSLASLTAGGCVPCLLDGREAYLQIQVRGK